jgi:hypothetical protein
MSILYPKEARMGSTMLRRLALIVAMAMAGCATIMNRGRKQWVTVTSTPTGATATIDGVTTIQTPGQAKLKRGKDHVIVIEKEGYETSQTVLDHELSGWVFGNLVFGGLVGLAIDFGAGGAYKLDPDTINVMLRETEPPQQPSPEPAI